MSADKDPDLEHIKDEIVKKIDVMRIFLKPQGEKPDLDEPLIIKTGSTVKDLCKSLHHDFLKDFRYALLWGDYAKHEGQHIGLKHKLHDGDIVSIIKKIG